MYMFNIIIVSSAPFIVNLYFRAMPYSCDTCGNKYKYKQTLTWHMNEKHGHSEHWNCVESGSESKCIRRSYMYLVKHLILKHRYTLLNARERACRAPRGDVHATTYYKDVGDYDTVCDIYDEIEWIWTHEKSVLDFKLDYLDDISIEHVVEGTDGNVQTDQVETRK